ncbi:hypothetical protein [Draconibacterium orientale]|uniref:hypothetical protein n=1 Tax=Draconibacterium orientale TaxID=1168034 RepID=UPI0029C06D22|nr:hypothetical protein [Draconibacterium orientale]
MNHKDILGKLQALDLTQIPNKEIKELLTILFQFGIPIITTDYNYPKIIERAVNNTEEETEFNSKSRISFKPAAYNTTYQRASTPETTMFYASVIPEGELSTSEIEYSRIIGAWETVDVLRENSDGERLITFGQWQIQEQVSVMTIFDPNLDYQVKYINEVRDFYNKQRLPEDLNQIRNDVLGYLAFEFSKVVSKGNNHDYMISAILTELATANGADGVLYPSVQGNGAGLCVSLHPRIMNKLKLVKVLQCKLTKKGNEAKLLNIKHCEVKDNSETFKLEEIK